MYMHDSSNRCCGGQKIYVYLVENLGPLHLSFVCTPGASGLTSSLFKLSFICSFTIILK